MTFKRSGLIVAPFEKKFLEWLYILIRCSRQFMDVEDYPDIDFLELR